MSKKYRVGAIGALMDEYEKASVELIALLLTIDIKSYQKIIDSKTKDKDCVSIQTIMNHVIRAAYGYSNLIRKEFGNEFQNRKTIYDVETPEKAISELYKALKYTEEGLNNKWNITYKEIRKHIIQTSWGQDFDIDQLLEHAIVHILRHRRQIENFLLLN